MTLREQAGRTIQAENVPTLDELVEDLPAGGILRMIINFSWRRGSFKNEFIFYSVQQFWKNLANINEGPEIS